MHEIGSEYDQDQALAICYASFEKSNMSSSKFSEYRIKTQMGLAVKDAENRGIKLAEEGKLDPVVGRENEINRIAQILSRRKKKLLGVSQLTSISTQH